MSQDHISAGTRWEDSQPPSLMSGSRHKDARIPLPGRQNTQDDTWFCEVQVVPATVLNTFDEEFNKFYRRNSVFIKFSIIIIIVELDIGPMSQSQDFRGTSSGALRGAGGRRLDGNSLNHIWIASPVWNKTFQGPSNKQKNSLFSFIHYKYGQL